MPTLVLTKINSTYLEFKYEQDNGSIQANYQFNPLSVKEQRRISVTTGVALVDLLPMLERVRQQDVARGLPKPTLSMPVAGPIPATSDTFALRMRGLYQKSHEATIIEADTPGEALEKAFTIREFNFTEPVLEWDDIKSLACLDVDYHDDRHKPTDTWRTYHAGITRPTALYDHLSHGGGVKLYYVACEGYNANELAAVGAIHWLSIDGNCKPEIKSQSRHPLYIRSDTRRIAGEVNKVKENCDVSALAKWFGREVDPATVQDWLDEKGYKIGDRLMHEHCPILPGYESHGTPIFIGDYGISCHSCESAGRNLGGRKPGFVSYSRLLGTVSPVILQLVKRFCHWEHARIVLSDKLRLDERIIKLAYAALLKMFHGTTDPRISMAFTAGKDMVRQLRRWTTLDGAYTYNDVSPMFATLPAVQITSVDSDGNYDCKPSAELVTRFGTGSVLSDFGYPAVTPLVGAKIYGHYLDYPDDRILYPVSHRSFTGSEGRYSPRYLPPKARHKDAWEVVERFFPGVCREYVKLLLIQKGYIEGSQAQAPFVLVSGPTKAGKSTTIHIAASIAGDYCTDITWHSDTTRLRQAIYEGADSGTYIAVNEVFKESTKAKVTPTAALDPVLNLTQDSTSHVMYVGPQRLDKLPALVCTDTQVPKEVYSDQQLARRFIYVRLNNTCEWDKTILESGLAQPRLFRCYSDETALAANSILSDVIDEYFSSPCLWVDSAGKLGYTLLSRSDAWENADEQLKLLFTLICEAPELPEKEAKRYPGEGWKMIRQEDTTQLAELWGELTGDNWIEARRASATDWTKLLNAKNLVHFDCRSYKRGIVFVRFRVGSSKTPDAVNGRIVQCG